MIVQIIKCSISKAWYRNKIGSIYVVFECEGNDRFYITKSSTNIVKKEDVEHLPEEGNYKFG